MLKKFITVEILYNIKNPNKPIIPISLKLALSLKVKGLLNIQFAIKNDEIFVIEVNPRASRTVPFVSKANGIPLAKIASKIMAGEKLSKYKLKYF